METKEIKITPPEGYEIDKENSTFECIKFKPKSLTYEDMASILFDANGYYYIDTYGRINQGSCRNFDPNNATSKKQLEKLLAINKLMNVAKYLNGDWNPDWNDVQEDKWFIQCMGDLGIRAYKHISSQIAPVYFRAEEFICQAIDILGKDTIRLALSTDW